MGLIIKAVSTAGSDPTYVDTTEHCSDTVKELTIMSLPSPCPCTEGRITLLIHPSVPGYNILFTVRTQARIHATLFWNELHLLRLWLNLCQASHIVHQYAWRLAENAIPGIASYGGWYGVQWDSNVSLCLIWHILENYYCKGVLTWSHQHIQNLLRVAIFVHLVWIWDWLVHVGH